MSLLDGLMDSMSNPIYESMCDDSFLDELEAEAAIEAAVEEVEDDALSEEDVEAIMDDDNPDNLDDDLDDDGLGAVESRACEAFDDIMNMYNRILGSDDADDVANEAVSDMMDILDRIPG